MNTLNIDQDELTREAEAAIRTRQAAAAPFPGEDGPPADNGAPGESWAPVVAGFMGLADVVAPNWELQPPEKNAFADALTPILDQLFPGGFGNERWAPYVRLVAVTAGIVMVRMENGRLRPLRAPQAPPPAEVDQAPGTAGNGP